jgi:hypothetical protein
MGWTGERASRAEVVNREKGPETYMSTTFMVRVTTIAIKTHRHKDEDWFLYQVKNAETGEILDTFIQVMIWDQGMHKEMCEACGPYYYGCPVGWFDLAPEPALGCSKVWRADVRAQAELRKSIQNYRSVRGLAAA